MQQRIRVEPTRKAVKRWLTTVGLGTCNGSFSSQLRESLTKEERQKIMDNLSKENDCYANENH